MLELAAGDGYATSPLGLPEACLPPNQTCTKIEMRAMLVAWLLPLTAKGHITINYGPTDQSPNYENSMVQTLRLVLRPHFRSRRSGMPARRAILLDSIQRG